MSTDNSIKTSPKIAIAGGTAAGTSSIIDTSGFTSMYMYSIGTTGSCTSNVWVNFGTAPWSGTVLSAQVVLVGTQTAGGTGISAYSNIAGLGNQAIITQSTINGTYTTSYILHD